MSRLVTFVALALVAGAVVGDETEGAGELRVDVGRLAVMLNGVDQISQQLPSMGATPLSDAARLDMELRAVVFRYNAHRAEMCMRQQLDAMSCGEAYLPAWALEKPAAAPSLAVLARRRDEVQQRVVPYWEAVCDATRRVAKLISSGACQVE